MKLIQTFLIAFLFVTHTASAQDCPPGNIELNSQDDVDNFLILYPDCTELQGDLVLLPFSFFDEPINNLNGLSNIESINGTLEIGVLDSLQSLSGLEGLTDIGGELAYT